MARKQRLVFGEVAEVYERVRPGYPPALFDDLAALAGLRSGARVLEIGCGTGQATVPLAERGFRVTALEPSAEMAAVARSNCAGLAGVEIEVASFEAWRPGGRRFDAVVAAQAWHWVDPASGFEKAASCLVDGGHLGVFWNLPVDRGGDLAGALDEVYTELAPGLEPLFPKLGAKERDAPWGERIAASGWFGTAECREHPWARDLATAEFQALLSTQSDHRLLPDEQLTRLLAAVGAAVDGAGGAIRIGYVARLYVARRRD